MIAAATPYTTRNLGDAVISLVLLMSRSNRGRRQSARLILQ
jgi:hypothetical protein